MSNEDFRKAFAEKVLSDYRNHLFLYQRLQKEENKMIGVGLGNTVEYRRLFELTQEQRYFVTYLKKIIEYVDKKGDDYMNNFFSKKSSIIGLVKVWKKYDIKTVRKLRNKHGSGAVEVMKKSINNSVYKIEKYIDSLEEELKGI
tara:strand:- start:152 stop:583 length:432 start_codon:yes stop_codon:yes gene_type:complete